DVEAVAGGERTAVAQEKHFEERPRLAAGVGRGAESVVRDGGKQVSAGGVGAGGAHGIDSETGFQSGIPGKIEGGEAEGASQPFSFLNDSFAEIRATEEGIREGNFSGGDAVSDAGAADRFSSELEAGS